MNLRLTLFHQMYRYILPIVFLILSLSDLVQAQANSGNKLRGPDSNALRVSRAGGKRISVAFGRYQTILNLSADISGCLSVWDSMEHFPRMSPKPKIHQQPLDLRVVDRINQGGKHYVVIAAGAAPNCNVQGHCGASDPDITLIWLKLNDHLNIERKQAVIINSCLEGIIMSNPDEMKDLKLAGDELTVLYETTREGSSGSARSHLAYNRKLPDKGFIIRTE